MPYSVGLSGPLAILSRTLEYAPGPYLHLIKTEHQIPLAHRWQYAPALALVQARPSTLAWLEAPVAKRKKPGRFEGRAALIIQLQQ